MQTIRLIKKSLYVAMASFLICSSYVYAQEDAQSTANDTTNTTTNANTTTDANAAPDTNANINSTTTTSTTSVSNEAISPTSLEAANPLTLAASWLQDAKNSGTLSKYVIMGTLKDMHPSIKVIAMGELTPEGYVFKLNESSNTSREITESPSATILITWGDKAGGDMQKQIRIYGSIAPQGAIETHSVTFQGKQLDYKSRTYILKPAGIQLGIINSGNATSGVVDYINYTFSDGNWTKGEKKTMAFDLNSQQ